MDDAGCFFAPVLDGSVPITAACHREKQLPTEQEFIEKYKNEDIKNIKEEIRREHRKKTDYQEATRSHQIDFTQEVSESNTKINVLKQKLQEIQSL